MLSAINIQNVTAQAEITSPLPISKASSGPQRELACPVCGVAARKNSWDRARDAAKKQAFPEEASEHPQHNACGAFPSGKGGHVIRRLAFIAARAVYVGFIALWAGVWALLLLSVYGGLPFILA